MNLIEQRDWLLKHLPEAGLAINMLVIGGMALLLRSINAGDENMAAAVRGTLIVLSFLDALTASADTTLLVFTLTNRFIPAPESASLARPERIGNYLLIAVNSAAMISIIKHY
jgi:hypothetical protein